MADPARVLGVLKALREMGVELALDDFGTGYSSLAYLKRLPVHELKIDKSFVMNMAGDESDAIIVQSTIGLARNLRLRVVAEGVEDQAAWDELVALGCDVAQGFFFGRPMPAAEMTAWLNRSRLPVHAIQ
jgi:EAL domain-containing protein (putative c-di-GMP-specific phosphodiesterase class I)